MTSAGNGGPVRSPASADAALAVGAVDRTDTVADFSSYGPRIGDTDDHARVPGLTLGVTPPVGT